MRPEVFLCEPIYFKNICCVYPPSVRAVVAKKDFPIYRQALTLSQEDIWDKNKENNAAESENERTPFEMLLLNYYHSETARKKIIEAFRFFTREEVKIMPEERMILFTSNLEEAKTIEDLRILREEDFFDFQNTIRNAIGEDDLEQPIGDEDPRVARIKALARKRERLKKEKGSSGGGVSLSTNLAAICCMGIGINPLNIGEISYASLSLLTSLYQNKESYEADIKMLAGGADPKKMKVKYWIREEK